MLKNIMEKANVRISENPKPVTLPAGFVSMNELSFPQRLLKSIVNRFGFFSKLVIKADDRTGNDGQATKMLQGSLNIVIRDFDLMTQKRSLGSCVRSDKGVGDFIFTPTVNNTFTIDTPVITVYEAGGSKFAVNNIFLNMFCRMVARRNIFAAAKRTDIKVNIDGFINMIGIAAKPSLMTDRSAALLRVFRRFFLRISVERSLERFGKFCLKMRLFIFKLFNPGLKFPDLVISEVHATSEQFHSEFKTDMGLERLPSGKFATNALILNLAALSYNCLCRIGQKALTCQDVLPVKVEVSRRRLRSVLQDLIYIGCKFTRHANTVIVKFSRTCPWFDCFREIYTRC